MLLPLNFCSGWPKSPVRVKLIRPNPTSGFILDWETIIVFVFAGDGTYVSDIGVLYFDWFTRFFAFFIICSYYLDKV